MTRIFHWFLCERWIPCQALTSVLCLHYRPETVHCSELHISCVKLTMKKLSEKNTIRVIIRTTVSILHIFDQRKVSRLHCHLEKVNSLLYFKEKSLRDEYSEAISYSFSHKNVFFPNVTLSLMFGCRRLYQYIKDNFNILVWIVKKLFWNYKFASNKREAF